MEVDAKQQRKNPQIEKCDKQAKQHVNSDVGCQKDRQKSTSIRGLVLSLRLSLVCGILRMLRIQVHQGEDL